MKKYRVYKVTCLINGKVYVGATTKTLYRRFIEHCCKSNSVKSFLSKAIMDLGRENFKIELFKEFLDPESMYDCEVNLISTLKSNNPDFGYNNSTGGACSSKGKKLSVEARLKISAYQKIRIRKPHSEEAKKNMSLAAKGRDMSKAVKASVEANKGKPSKLRQLVKRYSLNGDYIDTFDSMTLAAKSVGGITTALSMVKKGRLKTYKGFKWKF